MIQYLNKWSIQRRLLTGLAPVLLLGCSSVPMAPGTAYAQSSDSISRSQADADSQLMFEIMISELAGRRGQLDVAMTGYLRAAGKTDDPRVSERATRLASFGRQWADAEMAARRWQELDAESVDAPQFLAQALMQQGKSEEAAEQYIEIVKLSSEKEETLREIQASVQAADADQIVGIMTSLSDAFPTLAESHLAMARAFLLKGDRESAVASADKALAIEPKNTPAILLKAESLSVMGQPEAGLKVAKDALEQDPDNVRLRLGYAQVMVQAGRYDEVGEQLDEIFAADSLNPDTLLTISSLALDSRRVERARVYLTRLLETGEYQDQANYYLARISDQQQDYYTAIEFYDAVEGGDLQLRSQIRVAELLGRIGEVEQGRERLKDLATVHSNPGLQTQFLTAESRLLQSADRPQEAVDVLSGGLERFPENGDLLYARALAADAAGNEKMLLDDLNMLIDLQPDNAHALNALGYHLADNNRELDKAEELLIKANELLPNDPAIMDSLGWLFYRQGKLDEAIELLQQAFVLLPDSEIAAHLGEALWLSGREQEATDVIQNALAKDPDDDKLLLVKQKYIE